MVLRVEFEQFATTARKVLAGPIVAISETKVGSKITASENGSPTIVACSTSLSIKEAQASLKKQGIECVVGQWEGSGDDRETPDFSIGAVAYKSHESTPGLWVEAFPDTVSKSNVLRALYEEFCKTGELSDTSLEEFLENTHPNVVVLSPAQILDFLDARIKNS